MKPNDKAYEAALRATSDSCSPYQIKNALDAAYAAQFPPSEDYAGLVKELRPISHDIHPLSINGTIMHKAADAIEAVLAERDTYKNWLDNYEKQFAAKVEELVTVRLERDALKADLASARDRTWFWEIVDANGLNNVASSEKDALRKLVRDSAILDGLKAQFGNVGERNGKFTLNSTFQALLDVIDLNVETSHEKIAAIEERDAAIKERDALLARLAPVDDEALVEIVTREIFIERKSLAAAIAAIRPHIEAAERERCAKIAEKYENEKANYLLDPSARSVATLWRGEIAAAIRSGKWVTF